MGRTYFVVTVSEASQAVERLRAYGFEATSEPDGDGHWVTIANPSTVTVEEILINTAPTVRRVLVN